MGIIAASRLRGTGFDPDYQAILDRATFLGYSKPSDDQRIIQNQLVLDLKLNSIWSKLDALWILVNDAGYDFSTLNWLKPSENQIFSDSDAVSFLSNDQVIFSSVTNFNFNPFNDAVKYQLNNCSYGWYSGNVTNIAANSIQMGAYEEDTSGGGLQNQVNPATAVNGFSNKILVNRSGGFVGTKRNYGSRVYNYGNSFISVHLINNKANFSLNTTFDREVTMVPESLTNISFKTSGSANQGTRLNYIGEYFSLSEKTTFKNIFEQYETDINL
jgi:hypothetical protein